VVEELEDRELEEEEKTKVASAVSEFMGKFENFKQRKSAFNTMKIPLN